MGTFSIWHWLIVGIAIFVYGIPMARIIRRAGYSRLWVIAFFVPVLNVIALWILAFVRWPATAPTSVQISN